MQKVLAIILTLCLCLTAEAKSSKIQALYLLQFAKNTSWATEDVAKDFVITVIGDNDVASELKSTISNKTIGNRKVVIKQTNDIAQLPQSDIIYLGESKKDQISKLIYSQRRNRVLIVSGTEGQCSKGAAICFAQDNDKLNFEINEGNIAKKGLKVTPKLVQRGKQVF